MAIRSLAKKSMAGMAGIGVGVITFAELLRRADRRRVSDWDGEPYASPAGGVDLETVSADGTPLHLVVHGEGDRTVFLLHGWVCNSTFYRYQQRYLQEGYKVVSLDLRGHGKSGSPSNRKYDIDHLAEDLKAAVDLIGPERFVVVGHSLGGFTTFRFFGRFSKEYPGRLKGLVIVSSSGFPLERGVIFGWAFRAFFPFPLDPLLRITARIGFIAEPMMKLFKHSLPTYTFARLATFGRKPAGEDVEHVLEQIMSTRWASLVMAAKTCIEQDNTHVLPEIDVPVLMQVGGQDLLMSLGVTEETLRLIPDARLEVYDGTGHCVLLEKHDEVNSDLDEFLRHVFAH